MILARWAKFSAVLSGLRTGGQKHELGDFAADKCTNWTRCVMSRTRLRGCGATPHD